MGFLRRHTEPLSLFGKLRALSICALLMVVGLVVFKYIPEQYYGSWITFDASLHVTATVFALYVVWYFIDQNSLRWRHTYIIVSSVIVAIVAVERIFVGAHDSIGIILALLISGGAIGVSRWSTFKRAIHF